MPVRVGPCTFDLSGYYLQCSTDLRKRKYCKHMMACTDIHLEVSQSFEADPVKARFKLADQDGR